MMKNFVYITMVMLGLSACGQKGALYLSEKPNNLPISTHQDKKEPNIVLLTEENLQEDLNDY